MNGKEHSRGGSADDELGSGWDDVVKKMALMSENSNEYGRVV